MIARISEDWLKSVGFKWSQFDRRPNKQWTLWLGGCLDCPADGAEVESRQRWRFSGDEDFAIEMSYGPSPHKPETDPDFDYWFCFFRGDSAGRYHRFIHVRHMRYQHEVLNLVCALTGRRWNPDNHINGSAKCDWCAGRIRKSLERIDQVALHERASWFEAEKDDTRGRALPEHMDAAIKSGLGK